MVTTATSQSGVSRVRSRAGAPKAVESAEPSRFAGKNAIMRFTIGHPSYSHLAGRFTFICLICRCPQDRVNQLARRLHRREVPTGLARVLRCVAFTATGRDRRQI